MTEFVCQVAASKFCPSDKDFHVTRSDLLQQPLRGDVSQRFACSGQYTLPHLTDVQACRLKLKETNISTKHRRLKCSGWREADQLAIYKHDRGVEPGSSKKQLQSSGQSGT